MQKINIQNVPTNATVEHEDLVSIIFDVIKAAMSEDLTDFEGIEVTTIPYTVYGVKISIPLKK